MDEKSTAKVFLRLPIPLEPEEVKEMKRELESVMEKLTAPVDGEMTESDYEEHQKEVRALRRHVIELKWDLQEKRRYTSVECIEEIDPVTEEVITTRLDTMEVVPPIWNGETMEKYMEKYGVKTDNELTKKGSPDDDSCPLCGSKLSSTNPPICPKCGSEPLEESGNGDIEETE